MTDQINHPAHYNSGNAKCECGRRIECIDVTRHMNFNIGNAVKYLWRFAHKEGIVSLKKAIWYIQDQIYQIEKQEEKERNEKYQVDYTISMPNKENKVPCRVCGIETRDIYSTGFGCPVAMCDLCFPVNHNKISSFAKQELKK